ncbi:hypothetical protein COO60DRAFT_543586 [Scenedesmus sp. NREL 46B-D3]|nr:hypothetical protein COO60DRAFT_543586 [Scenedesmus sp. NREL 46B-D3]
MGAADGLLRAAAAAAAAAADALFGSDGDDDDYRMEEDDEEEEEEGAMEGLETEADELQPSSAAAKTPASRKRKPLPEPMDALAAAGAKARNVLGPLGVLKPGPAPTSDSESLRLMQTLLAQMVEQQREHLTVARSNAGTDAKHAEVESLEELCAALGGNKELERMPKELVKHFNFNTKGSARNVTWNSAIYEYGVRPFLAVETIAAAPQSSSTGSSTATAAAAAAAVAAGSSSAAFSTGADGDAGVTGRDTAAGGSTAELAGSSKFNCRQGRCDTDTAAAAEAKAAAAEAKAAASEAKAVGAEATALAALLRKVMASSGLSSSNLPVFVRKKLSSFLQLEGDEYRVSDDGVDYGRKELWLAIAGYLSWVLKKRKPIHLFETFLPEDKEAVKVYVTELAFAETVVQAEHIGTKAWRRPIGWQAFHYLHCALQLVFLEAVQAVREHCIMLVASLGK